MKRIFGRVVVVCAAALGLGAFAPACVENDQSLFVRNVLAPSTNRQNGQCVYTDDPQQAALFSGTLDLAFRDNYRAIVIVGNQLIGRGDPANTRAESNRVHLNGAIVRVTNPDGSQIAEFTSLATGFADIQSSNNPSFGTMQVVLIDKPTSDALRGSLPANRATKQIIIFIKAFGKTLGGVDLESGEFQFPVEACNGCLVKRTLDPAQPGVGCPATAAGGSTTEESPCETGQDESIPCESCRGNPVCDNP